MNGDTSSVESTTRIRLRERREQRVQRFVDTRCTREHTAHGVLNFGAALSCLTRR
jgi:hypothetical protein